MAMDFPFYGYNVDPTYGALGTHIAQSFESGLNRGFETNRLASDYETLLSATNPHFKALPDDMRHKVAGAIASSHMSGAGNGFGLGGVGAALDRQAGLPGMVAAVRNAFPGLTDAEAQSAAEGGDFKGLGQIALGFQRNEAGNLSDTRGDVLMDRAVHQNAADDAQVALRNAGADYKNAIIKPTVDLLGERGRLAGNQADQVYDLTGPKVETEIARGKNLNAGAAQHEARTNEITAKTPEEVARIRAARMALEAKNAVGPKPARPDYTPLVKELAGIQSDINDLEAYKRQNPNKAAAEGIDAKLAALRQQRDAKVEEFKRLRDAGLPAPTPLPADQLTPPGAAALGAKLNPDPLGILGP